MREQGEACLSGYKLGKGEELWTKPWFSRCAELQSKATPEVTPGQVGPGLGVQAMLVDHLGPGLSCYCPWLMNYLRRLLVTLGVCGKLKVYG